MNEYQCSLERIFFFFNRTEWFCVFPLSKTTRPQKAREKVQKQPKDPARSEPRWALLGDTGRPARWTPWALSVCGPVVWSVGELWWSVNSKHEDGWNQRQLGDGLCQGGGKTPDRPYKCSKGRKCTLFLRGDCVLLWLIRVQVRVFICYLLFIGGYPEKALAH